MSRFRKLLLFAGAFALLCALIPVFYGIFNAGSAALFLIGLVLVLLARFWPRITKHACLRRGLLICLWLGVAFFLFVSALIAWRAWGVPPPEGGKQTLIVLGAHVYNTGPSRMLRYRLDKAYAYLTANPEAVCIVTGGQGADEPCTEASAMAEYLRGRGIATERIFLEETSTSTDENLRFSLPLIPPDSEGIVIVTNDFHHLRASQYAANYGITPHSLSGPTPPGLLPVYWVREIGGATLEWLRSCFA